MDLDKKKGTRFQSFSAQPWRGVANYETFEAARQNYPKSTRMSSEQVTRRNHGRERRMLDYSSLSAAQTSILIANSTAGGASGSKKDDRVVRQFFISLPSRYRAAQRGIKGEAPESSGR